MKPIEGLQLLKSYLHVVVKFEGVVEVEEVLHLVVGDAAVDHRLPARVHDDEGQLERPDRVIR